MIIFACARVFHFIFPSTLERAFSVHSLHTCFKSSFFRVCVRYHGWHEHEKKCYTIFANSEHSEGKLADEPSISIIEKKKTKTNTSKPQTYMNWIVVNNY